MSCHCEVSPHDIIRLLYPSPCAGTNSSCSWLSHCRNGSRLSLLNSAWPKVETHAGGQAARRFCKAPWQRCWVTGFRWRLFKVPISFRRPTGRPPLLVYWLFPDGEALQLPMVGQKCRRSFSDPQPGNGQSRAAEGLPCQRKGQTKPWGCILAEKLPHGDPPCIIQSWMTMTYGHRQNFGNAKKVRNGQANNCGAPGPYFSIILFY